MDNIRAIACNFAKDTNKNSKGSLAYVLDVPGDLERMLIFTRTRSGRWVKCWEDAGRLTNFRWKTIPPEHPRYADLKDWKPRATDVGLDKT